jgi:hypothetical protein
MNTVLKDYRMVNTVFKLFSSVGLVYTGCFKKYCELSCRLQTFAVLVNYSITSKYGVSALLKLDKDRSIIYCGLDPKSLLKKEDNETAVAELNKELHSVRVKISEDPYTIVNLAVNKYGVVADSPSLVLNLSNKSSESGNFKITRINRVENLVRLYYE